MSPALLSRWNSFTVLAALAVAGLASTRSQSSNKVLGFSAVAMGLLLRQIFSGTGDKLIADPAALPTSEEYDIIIVGGGSSLVKGTPNAKDLKGCGFWQVLQGVSLEPAFQKTRQLKYSFWRLASGMLPSNVTISRLKCS